VIAGTAPVHSKSKVRRSTGDAPVEMRRAPTHRPGATTVKVITWVTVIVAVALGVALRAWLIFHEPINSDEAVVGLMAAAGLHGHFTAFYWGQAYGGTAETELTSVFFAIFGQTALAAKLTVVFISAACALLTWRITLRLVPVPGVAAMVGALVWAAPFASVSFSVLFYGFRGVTLACGLVVLLCALRMLDGRRSVFDFVLLGLAAGVGWWSSPEIVYYLIPAGLIFVGAIVATKGSQSRVWILGTLVAVPAMVIGALPWFWANLHTHFGSFNSRKFEAVSSLNFGDRLNLFYRFVFPTELGLRRGSDLAWIAQGLGDEPTKLLLAFAVGLVAIALVLCLARGGRATAIALAVLAFPLLYAVSPAASAFANGRYGIFLPPLLAMAFAIGSCEAVRRLSRGRSQIRAARPDRATAPVGRWWPGSTALVMSGVVLVALLFSTITFSESIGQPHAYTRTWGNPDQDSLAALQGLERGGVSAGYANYWVAYKLDFLSHNRLTLTPIGNDIIRSQPIESRVLASKHTAWLFVPPNKANRGASQFSAPALTIGPDGVPQSTFVARLDRLRVHYRLIQTAVVNAVVPDRTVTPAQLDMPGVTS
jgi:hypothetical protein